MTGINNRTVAVQDAETGTANGKKGKKRAEDRFSVKHPVLSMALIVVFGFLLYGIVGGIVGFIFGDEFTGFGAAACSVFMLWMHKVNYSSEYKGSISGDWLKAGDVKKVFTVMAVLILIIDLLGFIGNGIEYKTENLGLALMAGIGEETVVRAIPVSIMMKSWMDRKHIPFIVISTSVVFGLIHVLNAASGAGLVATVVQVLFAAGIGIFFAAVYIRTANIMITIIFHAIHDFIAFLVAGATEGGIMQSISAFDAVASIIMGAVCAVAGLYLIRGSVRDDIVSVWKNRWSVEG